MVDLYDLTERLLAVEDDVDITAALISLQQAVDSAVIAEVHGLDWRRVHGLSIFLPSAPYASELSSYVGRRYGLDLVSDTRWDEVLDSLVQHYPALAVEPADAETLPFCGDRNTLR